MLGRRSRTPPDHRFRSWGAARRSGQQAQRGASGRLRSSRPCTAAVIVDGSNDRLDAAFHGGRRVRSVCRSRRPPSPEPGQASRAVVARTAERRWLRYSVARMPAPRCATTSARCRLNARRPEAVAEPARLRRSFGQPGANAGRIAGRLREGSTLEGRGRGLQCLFSGSPAVLGTVAATRRGIRPRLEDWGQRCRRQDGAG